mmetsp:Transcript_17962/g.57436  ORF Transcript_17962/g.57436 Transcript_17962/m.57436 type:complete len:276 (+) Transcript_17962:1060-1887(+)
MRVHRRKASVEPLRARRQQQRWLQRQRQRRRGAWLEARVPEWRIASGDRCSGELRSPPAHRVAGCQHSADVGYSHLHNTRMWTQTEARRHPWRPPNVPTTPLPTRTSKGSCGTGRGCSCSSNTGGKSCFSRRMSSISSCLRLSSSARSSRRCRSLASLLCRSARFAASKSSLRFNLAFSKSSSARKRFSWSKIARFSSRRASKSDVSDKALRMMSFLTRSIRFFCFVSCSRALRSRIRFSSSVRSACASRSTTNGDLRIRCFHSASRYLRWYWAS